MRRAWRPVLPLAALAAALVPALAQETADVRVAPGALAPPRQIAPESAVPPPGAAPLPAPGLPYTPPAQPLPPQATPAPPPVVAAQPDDRSMWAAIARSDPAAARRAIAALEQKFPAWRPSAEALRLIAALEFDVRVKRDAASKNWRDIAAAAAQHPEQLSCARPDHVWAAADAAQAMGEAERERALYAGLVQRCPDGAAMGTTLRRIADNLPPPAADALLAEAERRKLRGDPAGLRYRVASRRLDEALAGQAGAVDPGVTAALAADTLARRDPAAAAQLGWAALRAGDYPRSRRWFERARAWGAGDQALEGLATLDLRQGRFDEARRIAAAMPGGAARQGIERDLHVALAGAALRRGEAQAALNEAAVARGLGAPDAAIGIVEGYALLALKRYDEAASRFQALLAAGDPAARPGLARVRVAQGRFEEAERIAEAAPAGNERDALLGDIALARANAAYDAGDYDGALHLARAARQTPGNALGLGTVEAWSLYHEDQFGAAAMRFEQLYRGAPNADLAEGLYLSLAKSDPARIPMLSLMLGGPFTKRAVEGVADGYYARKQFVAAHDTAPAHFPLLDNIGANAAYGALQWRDKSGTPGLDRLTEYDAAAGDAFGSGADRFTVTLNAVHLEAGTPAPGALIGNPGKPQLVAPIHTLGAGFEPWLSWDRQDVWEPFAALGLTPVGGELAPLPVGDLGVRHFDEDGGYWRLTALAAPKRESVLSYTGIVDPSTGAKFGRIIEAGGALDAYQPLGRFWSLTGQAALTRLTGTSVVANRHIAAAAGLGYDLHPKGFDYLVVGPALNYDSYARNTFFFTTGNGGYFSPQGFARAGIAIAFLTDEQKDFSLRGRLEPGYDLNRADGAPYLPLADDGRRFAGSRSRGVSFNGQIEGVYRLTERWQAGARVMGNTGVDYTETVIGVFLRFTFGPRPATVSADLSPWPLGRP